VVLYEDKAAGECCKTAVARSGQPYCLENARRAICANGWLAKSTNGIGGRALPYFYLIYRSYWLRVLTMSIPAFSFA